MVWRLRVVKGMDAASHNRCASAIPDSGERDVAVVPVTTASAGALFDWCAPGAVSEMKVIGCDSNASFSKCYPNEWCQVACESLRLFFACLAQKGLSTVGRDIPRLQAWMFMPTR
jgi:hypothetical protein